MVVTVATHSSVTEEHGALRHNLGRRHNLAPYLKNFFGDFPPPSPKKFSVSVPFWESKLVGAPRGPLTVGGP
jgi:hypothetical protein